MAPESPHRTDRNTVKTSPEITTNNRERAYGVPDFLDDGPRTLTAYGYTFGEDEIMPADDVMRANGWDGYYPAAVTNAGAAVIVLRYFDRDGYELDGYVAGWMVIV